MDVPSFYDGGYNVLIVNESIRVKIVIILNFQDYKVICIAFNV